MTSRMAIPATLTSSPVIAIIRNPALPIQTVASTLIFEGIQTLEVTMNTRGALEAISSLRSDDPSDQTLIGAGSVLSPDAAESAVNAGAQFIVTPTSAIDTIRWCVDNAIPIFPGAWTPTEVLTSWNAGATAVKVFPYGETGSSHIAALSGPLGHIPLVPVGGITAENASEAITPEQCIGVGVGSWLTGSHDIDTIHLRAQALFSAVRSSTKGTE